MRKIILFSAVSLDGFIARENGDIDWLFTDGDYGYTEFYNSVDTLLMGRTTYEQVLTFGDYPYKDKQNYIFTNNKKLHQGDVVYIQDKHQEFASSLKNESGSDIWLVGGGKLNAALQKEKLIDEYILSIHPVILGKGIPLFNGECYFDDLKLLKHKSFESGLVQLHYKADSGNS